MSVAGKLVFNELGGRFQRLEISPSGSCETTLARNSRSFLLPSLCSLSRSSKSGFSSQETQIQFKSSCEISESRFSVEEVCFVL
ncbi:hypothetical protein NPIL_222801 [Nephila pilipes]|uniref:Uncharacterized protein n=1 Tax=Nephila pilipes TaxID=299642 RepID=A0A8X6U9R7_NEPPI|nr:hypothetical protein NPIL_222801 [Nephila pilipes]